MYDKLTVKPYAAIILKFLLLRFHFNVKSNNSWELTMEIKKYIVVNMKKYEVKLLKEYIFSPVRQTSTITWAYLIHT